MIVIPPAPPDRILSLNTVLERTGLSKATVYRKIKGGTFLPMVPLSKRRSGRRESPIPFFIPRRQTKLRPRWMPGRRL